MSAFEGPDRRRRGTKVEDRMDIDFHVGKSVAITTIVVLPELPNKELAIEIQLLHFSSGDVPASGSQVDGVQETGVLKILAKHLHIHESQHGGSCHPTQTPPSLF